jgi:uncharacterized glyoxalase superfamily protein PhnB
LAPLRSFPIVYATSVAFYALLGFDETFRLPEGGDPGFVSMSRDGCGLAVVSSDWPRDSYGMSVGDTPRFELFVYVDNVQATFDAMKAVGVETVKPPAPMPWGETVGVVLDPDRNPVSLGQPTA